MSGGGQITTQIDRAGNVRLTIVEMCDTGLTTVRAVLPPDQARDIARKILDALNAVERFKGEQA